MGAFLNSPVTQIQGAVTANIDWDINNTILYEKTTVSTARTAATQVQINTTYTVAAGKKCYLYSVECWNPDTADCYFKTTASDKISEICVYINGVEKTRQLIGVNNNIVNFPVPYVVNAGETIIIKLNPYSTVGALNYNVVLHGVLKSV